MRISRQAAWLVIGLILLLSAGCAKPILTEEPDGPRPAATSKTAAKAPASAPIPAPQSSAVAVESDITDGKAADMDSLGKAAFEQTGVAGWQDMQSGGATGLVARHPVLPVGSKVELTNFDNSRRVVLVVASNEATQSGRIIEVSRAAAQQLGMMETGTARVGLLVLERPKSARKWKTDAPVKKRSKVAPPVETPAPPLVDAPDEDEAPAPAKKGTAPAKPVKAAAKTAKAEAQPPARQPQKAGAAKAKQPAQPTPAPAAAKTAAGASYFVQVGSFADKANAEGVVKRLKAAGYAASRSIAVTKDGKTLYRVQAGAFPDQASASKGQQSLAKDFPSGYVLKD